MHDTYWGLTSFSVTCSSLQAHQLTSGAAVFPVTSATAVSIQTHYIPAAVL